MKISIKCEIPLRKMDDLFTISTTDIGTENVYIALNVDGHEVSTIMDVYELEEAVTKCREAIEESDG